jgi:hypothetical protein
MITAAIIALSLIWAAQVAVATLIVLRDRRSRKPRSAAAFRGQFTVRAERGMIRLVPALKTEN